MFHKLAGKLRVQPLICRIDLVVTGNHIAHWSRSSVHRCLRVKECVDRKKRCVPEAQQALEHLGWWDGVRTRLVTAPDVRAALRLVEIGEAQLGIVYASDVTNRTDMGPIVRIPAEAHAPIRYPIACCSDDANALQFLEFVTGPDCADIFLDAGFAPN